MSNSASQSATKPTNLSALATLHRLLPFIAPYKKQVAFALVALIVAACTTLSIPYAFRNMIDAGFSTNSTQMQHVNQSFLFLFFLATLLAFATAARFYTVSWLGEKVTTEIRKAVYHHVLHQSPEFFETMQSGEVLSRLTTDTTLIQTVVGSSISVALRSSLLFLGGLIMLVFTSLKLSLMIIALLAIVVLPIILYGRRVRTLSRATQDSIADTSAKAGEILNAMTIVQAYTQEKVESDRYGVLADNAFSTALRRIRARSVLTLLAILLIFGAIVFVLWVGAHAVVAGTMSGGELSQFILYASIVAGSVGALSEVLGDVQRAAGASERLLELLALQPAITSPNIAIKQSELPIDSKGVRLSFNGVSFNYPSRPLQASVRDLSVDIEPGETVALVGASGAGKTTLFQLILRFYDPQFGTINLDGLDLRAYDLQTLRQRIGIVPQDSVIFSASALENIRYGNLAASDEEVIQAAKAAGADEFIQRLPDAYQSFLGERGVRLSGGQKQRIAIARALLKNPPLLLLDEATSALDAESERWVQQALAAATQGRTTLIIAHRLSTIQRADRILVLDHGRLVEQGTHQSLIELGGVYAKLAALQLLTEHDSGDDDMHSIESK